MTEICLPILIPICAAALLLFQRRTWRYFTECVTLFASILTLGSCARLLGKDISLRLPWFWEGADISLRLYGFSAFIILAASTFGLLIAVYSMAFLKGRYNTRLFIANILLSVGFLNGAALSNNLILMLFFWEGLQITQFCMIFMGGRQAFRTAAKALIILGVSDLFLMLGIAITGHLAGTYEISGINLKLAGLGNVAFLMLVIGAMAKAGSMPFHTWIPDAAVDAPLPFMALFPGALEKLIGIYFLARVSLDIFSTDKGSWASFMLMTVGALTILFAVMMALIQKDYKRLLSYHAISQVGYMILGVGTLVPAGIVGGLFHMVNNSLYKSCLFMTGGAVEKETLTTDLEKLGGLAKKMPVTFACFFVSALSISGVPPFNGFFSKELIYDGAIERGLFFYAAAVLGSFLTAASFLKLGHAAYLGHETEASKNAKDAPLSMLAPMCIITVVCLIFGIWNSIPINGLIQPSLGAHWLEGGDFSGGPKNLTLAIITILVLIAAVGNHIYGLRKGKAAVKAADHIHYAPVLSAIYDKAEKRWFDPYETARPVMLAFSNALYKIDRFVDSLYTAVSYAGSGISRFVMTQHSGSYKLYFLWSIAGAAAMAFLFLR